MRVFLAILGICLGCLRATAQGNRLAISPFQLDSIFSNSAWVLDTAEDDGWIMTIQFKDDGFDFLALNWAIGGGEAHCQYSISESDDFLYFNTSNCDSDKAEGAFLAYMTDLDTLKLAVPIDEESNRMPTPDQVQEWMTFRRYRPK